MFRSDGLILPHGERVNLNPLLTVGFTEDLRIGIAWNNERLEQVLRNMSIADLSKIKDAITIAVKQSLDKRLPTVFNVG